MSQDNAYYQFYKNAPSVSSFFNILYALEGNTFIVVLVVLEISNYMIWKEGSFAFLVQEKSWLEDDLLLTIYYVALYRDFVWVWTALEKSPSSFCQDL